MDKKVAINTAPEIPKTQIEIRRWWNQICINALTWGIPSGCSRFDSYDCQYCRRCMHRDDMTKHPKRAFIGFTPSPEEKD